MKWNYVWAGIFLIVCETTTLSALYSGYEIPWSLWVSSCSIRLHENITSVTVPKPVLHEFRVINYALPSEGVVLPNPRVGVT